MRATQCSDTTPAPIRAHRPVNEPPKERPPRPQKEPPDGDAPIKEPPDETPEGS